MGLPAAPGELWWVRIAASAFRPPGAREGNNMTRPHTFPGAGWLCGRLSRRATLRCLGAGLGVAALRSDRRRDSPAPKSRRPPRRGHPRGHPGRPAHSRPDRDSAAAADWRAAGDARGLRCDEAGRDPRPRRRRRRRPGRRGRLPARVRGSRAGTTGAGHGRHPAAHRLGHQVVQLSARGHPRRRRPAALGDAAGRPAADLCRCRPGSHAAPDGP